MAGYTHRIKYIIFAPTIKMWVSADFRTSSDMVARHVADLNANSKVKPGSITVELL